MTVKPIIYRINLLNLRDVQLDLKVLWDGHLARPNLGGQDVHPTRDQDFRKRVAHRVNFAHGKRLLDALGILSIAPLTLQSAGGFIIELINERTV